MNNPDINKTAPYFENIFTAAHEGIICVDHEGTILKVNPSFTKILGYEEHEILGKPFFILAYKNPKMIESLSHNALHRFYISEDASTEMIFLDKETHDVPVRFRSVLIRDKNDQIIEAIGMIEPLNELTGVDKAEGSLIEKMWEAQQNFDSVLNSSADAILLCDITGNILMANKAFLKMLDFTQEEVIGSHIIKFTAFEGNYTTTNGEEVIIDKEYINNTSNKFVELFEKGYVSNWETDFVRKDKVIVPIEATMSVLKDKDDERRGSIIIVRDITERKRAEKEIKIARDFLENIFKTSSDAIVVTDTQGNITMVNDTVEKMTDYTRNELIGQHMSVLTPSDEEICTKIDKEHERFHQEGRIYESENAWRRKDGHLIIMESNICLLKDKDGTIVGAVGFNRDITEKKRVEEDLKKSKEKYQTLIENANDGIISNDEDGIIMSFNKKAEIIFGYSCDEIIGKHITLLSPPSERDRQIKLLEKYKVSNELYLDGKTLEGRGIRKGGQEFDFEGSVFVLNIDKEKIITTILRDITEKKKVEKEIRETKDFLEKVIENSKDGILIADEMGYILSVNTALLEMSGYKREDLIGEHASIFAVEDKEVMEKVMEATAEMYEKGFCLYESQIKNIKNSKITDLECTVSLLQDDKGNNIAGVGIMRDITERKKMEKSLLQEKEFSSAVIETADVLITGVDLAGKVFLFNRKAEEVTGYSKVEVIGKDFIKTLVSRKEDSAFIKMIQEVGEGRTVNPQDVYMITKGGEERIITSRGTPLKDKEGKIIGILGIGLDITETKKMEQQLLQSEKLRSLGELAGGVAHDFNNVLAAILGRAQLLKMSVEPPPGRKERRKLMDDLKKGLEIIESAAKDGAETVRRIQEFARRRADDNDFTQVDINELINNSLEFTKAKWKNEAESKGINFKINKELSPLPSVAGSASELREVFTNIISNSIDAMPQGGDITIKTFKRGGHIMIEIEDTGCGIPKSIKDRVFDPFFTTKGVQSTGLGLSVSHGIIKRHQGTVKVDSIEGKGTAFTIEFPISEKAIKEEKVDTMPGEQRKARILIIEDEEEVRNVLASILTRSGHEVESASNGEQGIERFKKKEFDLVFTDLGMPGVSGWQVAEKVKSINGRVPVGVITGWNIEIDESEMKDKWVDLIIQKPFEVNHVLRLVQEGMILRDRFKAA